jgi:predicted small lipoprotein YifL
MKKMSKILALALALLMLLSLAACGEKPAEPTPAQNEPAPEQNEPAPAGNEAQEGEPSPDENELPIMLDGPAPEAEPENLEDFNWVKFAIPEGFEVVDVSYSITLYSVESNKIVLKVSSETLRKDQTVLDRATEVAERDGQTVGEPFELNGREWLPVHFDFDGYDCYIFYSAEGENEIVEVTAFRMDKDNPAVQTILNTVKLVPMN